MTTEDHPILHVGHMMLILVWESAAVGLQKCENKTVPNPQRRYQCESKVVKFGKQLLLVIL